MKKLTLLIITLALFTLAFADIYTIGTGTSTSGLCPFYGYYDYSWSKAIWTAAELTTAGVPANTPITGIGFYVGNTPSNYTMLDQRIYVRTTTLTSYGTAQDETGTGYPNPAYFLPLFQGNLTYNGGGWHYIMFTTPATWDGTSNLELLFENWDGEYVSGYPTFRYTSTSPNYMMVYKYQDDSFPAVAGTSSYNRPNVAIITPSTTPPEAPVLSLPLDGATGVSITPTLSWTAPTSGAVPTGYKVYLGVSTPLTTPFAETTTLSYTVPSANALQYNTTYFWTVSAYNENGEGPQADPVRSFTTRTDPTIYNFPYMVDFTTWPVPDWSQLKYTFGGTPATGGNWVQDDWLNVSGSTNKAARLNIFSTGVKDWLITPPIQIPDTGYELKFDLALMKYGTQSTPVVPGAQADDRFLVVISNYPDMSSPTILMEWNNTGSPNVYDNIPATGETYIIDLDSYVGTKYIGFYGESLIDTAGDNDLMVDNVMVRETPAVPIFSYSPTSLEFGTTNVNHPTAYQNVTVTNNGVGTLNIAVGDVSIVGTDAAMFSFDDSHLPAALSAGQSVIIPVCYNPTEIGNHTAILRIVYNSTNYDVSLSGNALSEYALNESFESTTFPPVGWANPGNWSRNTSYYKHGTASAYKYGSTYSQYILSTPKLTITPTSTLDFWAMCGSITGTLQVVYSEDRTTWTPVGDDITFAATYTWYHQVIDLSRLEGNNYYLGFRTGLQYASFYVDYVIGPEITPEAPGPVTLTSPSDLATGVNEFTTFTWTAPTTGGVPTGYKLYCDTNNPPTTLKADINALTYTLTTPLAYNTTYYWTVLAYNGAGNGPTAAVRSFTTRTDPTIYTLPYTESFEVGNTDGSTNIANWTQAVGPEFTSYYWTANSSQTTYNRTPRTGLFNVTLHYSGAAWLFRPVSLTGGTAYEFEAYARQDGAISTDATLGLYYGTEPTIAAMTPITGQVGLVNGDYQRIYGVFSPATSGIYYLGIKGWININPWYISLDDVTIREAPTAPVFSYSPTSINFGLLMQNVPSTPANVTVTNLGGGTIHIESSNISITGPNAAMFSFSDANLPADLNAGQSVIIPVTAIVTQEGPVSATLIITYEGTPYEVALSAEGLSSEIVIIGTGTDDLSLPIEPYFGYSYSQSIFLQSEINMTDRPIEKIYYYWNGAAATVNSNNWTVYMGHTSNTSFDSGTSWIPLSELTEVFSGTVTLPDVEGWIEIELTTPFTYNNAYNLVIAVDENADFYDSYNEYFYCTSELKTNRSIRYYSDWTNPDPAAPPTGTPVAGYPNVMLKFQEETPPPLPVELSSFTAVLTDQFYVQLTWISQSETNLSGYRVYRNEEKSLDNAILITPTMIPATNTSQEHSYTVEDREIENHTTYYYWLESVDFNNSQFHGPVIVTVEGNVPPVLPEVTTLNNAYPNPFRANNSTKIEVGIKAGETGTLTIYNIRGEVVKAVKLTQGYHTINWDGIDSKGKTCGSGIYFYRLNTPSLNQIKKMVIIK